MGVAYRLYMCVCIFTVSIPITVIDVVGYSVDGVRLMRSILLCICIIGSWDWPGVGIGVPICTD